MKKHLLILLIASLGFVCTTENANADPPDQQEIQIVDSFDMDQNILVPETDLNFSEIKSETFLPTLVTNQTHVLIPIEQNNISRTLERCKRKSFDQNYKRCRITSRKDIFYYMKSFTSAGGMANWRDC